MQFRVFDGKFDATRHFLFSFIWHLTSSNSALFLYTLKSVQSLVRLLHYHHTIDTVWLINAFYYSCWWRPYSCYIWLIYNDDDRQHRGVIRGQFVTNDRMIDRAFLSFLITYCYIFNVPSSLSLMRPGSPVNICSLCKSARLPMPTHNNHT